LFKKKKCQFKSRWDINYTCSEFAVEGSDYCIFHKPDKNEEETKLFEERIKEKLKEKDYDFRGFIFPETVDFKKDFGINYFEKEVNFSYAQFKGDVIFERTIFEEEAHFYGARFEGNVYFGEAQFNKTATFSYTFFKGNAYFSGAKFQRETYFYKTYFEQEASFLGAQFDDITVFSETSFEGPADFSRIQFKIADMSGMSIQQQIWFYETILKNACITPLHLARSAIIDFRNARLKNTDITRKDIEGHIKQEIEDELLDAKEVYLHLKSNFHSLGRYDDESWAFQKEKEMERKNFWKSRHYLRWLVSRSLSFLYGYGERPERPVLWSVGIIVLFSIIYRIIGIFDVSRASVANIWDCLYFSVVTFTTLGYGDVRPLVGIGRLLAGIEAFSGVFLIALFIFTFARRTGGR